MPISTHTEAARLLPLDVEALSELQKRGRACAYNERHLLGLGAIDLGSRPHGGITVFPRACNHCMPPAAEKALSDHRGMCEQCVDGGSCDTRKQLDTLVRQYRRPIAHCHWHGGLSDSCLPIRDVPDQGSGHGVGTYYACARCREQHRLTPMEGRS